MEMIKAIVVAASLAILGLPAQAELTEVQVLAMQAKSTFDKALSEGAKGVLILGGQTHTFGQVFCIPGIAWSAAASTRNPEPGMPEMQLNLYDNDDAASPYNTVMVLFRDKGNQMQWNLDNGIVEKQGKIFSAAGKLKASRMEELSNGNLKKVPMEDPPVAFATILQCK